MEPYAQIPDAGSFAASADLFTILVEELQSAEAAGLTACELEDLLAERGREVRRQLLQDHLNLRAAREEQAARQHRLSATGADGVTRTRVATGHHRQLATLFGTVQVTRCARRRPGAHDPQHHRTWVILVDGAGHQLDLIRSEAQRGGVTIHIVIDLIHVLEYIWKAAWSLHAAGEPAAEDWVAVKALAVLAGDSARAAAEISAEADAAGLTGTQRTGTDACVRYLTSKHEYLRYDQALTAGWPIATGVIEGACRHLIGDRLDITGAWWGLQGAEAILTLRAVIANGDYDDYWRYHLAREHQRLYPGTAQGQYTLSA